jgi:hypothetical protein
MRNRRLRLVCAVHRGRAWLLLAAWIVVVLIAHEVT